MEVGAIRKIILAEIVLLLIVSQSLKMLVLNYVQFLENFADQNTRDDQWRCRAIAFVSWRLLDTCTGYLQNYTQQQERMEAIHG